jgi:hypothetical protein
MDGKIGERFGTLFDSLRVEGGKMKDEIFILDEDGRRFKVPSLSFPSNTL